MESISAIQRRNKRMHDIFEPEIKRMQKCESIAKEILAAMRGKMEIDPCGLEEYQVINLISGIIRKDMII